MDAKYSLVVSWEVSWVNKLKILTKLDKLIKLKLKVVKSMRYIHLILEKSLKTYHLSMRSERCQTKTFTIYRWMKDSAKCKWSVNPWTKAMKALISPNFSRLIWNYHLFLARPHLKWDWKDCSKKHMLNTYLDSGMIAKRSSMKS